VGGRRRAVSGGAVRGAGAAGLQDQVFVPRWVHEQ
jgi:hypothetical protein